MFENLVESGSHSKDVARKGSFILVTLAIYAVLLLAAFVAGQSERDDIPRGHRPAEALRCIDQRLAKAGIDLEAAAIAAAAERTQGIERHVPEFAGRPGDALDDPAAVDDGAANTEVNGE